MTGPDLGRWQRERTLRNSALELKKKSVPADDAATYLAGEFKAKYPDWPTMNVTGFVHSIYAE